jgi:hypothetical protein
MTGWTCDWSAALASADTWFMAPPALGPSSAAPRGEGTPGTASVSMVRYVDEKRPTTLTLYPIEFRLYAVP